MKHKDYFPDPEPIPDDDLDAEIADFHLHVAMGLTAKDFVNPIDRQRFVAWQNAQSRSDSTE
jgi:hypothetical protein